MSFLIVNSLWFDAGNGIFYWPNYIAAMLGFFMLKEVDITKLNSSASRITNKPTSNFKERRYNLI